MSFVKLVYIMAMFVYKKRGKENVLSHHELEKPDRCS